MSRNDNRCDDRHEYVLKIIKEGTSKFAWINPEEHFGYDDNYYIKLSNTPMQSGRLHNNFDYNAVNIATGDRVLFEEDDPITKVWSAKFEQGLSKYERYMQIAVALSIIALIDSFIFGILYLCPFWFIFDFILFVSINTIMLVIAYNVIYGG